MSRPRRTNGKASNNAGSETDSSDSDSVCPTAKKSESLHYWTKRRFYATKSSAGRRRLLKDNVEKQKIPDQSCSSANEVQEEIGNTASIECMTHLDAEEMAAQQLVESENPKESDVSLSAKEPQARRVNQKVTAPSQPSTSVTVSNLDDSDDDFDLQSTPSQSITRSIDVSRPLRNRNIPPSDDESEEDSGSETTDSDEAHVKDRSPKTKKKKISKPVSRAPRGRKSNRSFRSSTPQKGRKSLSKKVAGHSPMKNREVFESLVNKCVYYLLIADQKKYVIKKQAIVEHVFKDQPCSATLFKDVIRAAGKVLQKIFGFELLSDKDQKDAYMIINVLKPELNVQDLAEYSRIKTQQRGLILFLLTVIFMNENPMPEDELWKALKPLGIDPLSRKPHPVFGDVRKFIGTELVRQMYLDSKSISKDPPLVEFSWGKRALQEVDKRDVLEFACQVMNNTRPEDWALQYKEAQEAANENREAEINDDD